MIQVKRAKRHINTRIIIYVCNHVSSLEESRVGRCTRVNTILV